MYYNMAKSVLETVNPSVPTVVALEGGYNFDVISECMVAVSLALLDEPWQGKKHKSASISPIATLMGRHQLKKMGKEIQSKCCNKGAIKPRLSKEVARGAVSSIKKSAKALANNGRCHGLIHVTAESESQNLSFNHFSSPKAPDCSLERKRKDHNDTEAITALMLIRNRRQRLWSGRWGPN